MSPYEGKRIWIIGASSGIGCALAKELHARGAELILSARNEGALQKLNEYLGSRHTILAFDVAEKEDFANCFKKLERIDSAIYMAATYMPGKIEDITLENYTSTLSINIQSVFTFLQYALPYLKRQGHGQIALCGSVAGYKGLPGGQPYSATKAAVINLAESLRAEMAGHNIDVRLISPGFVRTPLTDKNDFLMPMMIEPEDAARAIADGLEGRSFEIHFPKKFTFLMKVISLLPYSIYFPLARLIKG